LVIRGISKITSTERKNMSKLEKKQAAIVAHEYGGPEVLKYEQVQRPEPKDDEILIRVIAAGVNAVDASIRAGKFAKVFGTRLPLVPGSDIAGVVEKAGSKVTKFKNGESVFAYTDLKDGGGYAEYVVATEREASPKPQSLTHLEAAAVPIVALAAWQALGEDTLKRSYAVVKKGGFIVSIVPGPDPAELERRGIRGKFISVEPDADELAEIGKLIDQKKIKVIVSRTFPLSEAMKAQEQIATGHTRGKIVLKVAEEPK
jgi:NADPH:quinone reductase-like Zn-dependent oxidoreductase